MLRRQLAKGGEGVDGTRVGGPDGGAHKAGQQPVCKVGLDRSLQRLGLQSSRQGGSLSD